MLKFLIQKYMEKVSTYVVSKYWNQLPTELHIIETKLEFKQMLTYDIISELEDQ